MRAEPLYEPPRHIRRPHPTEAAREQPRRPLVALRQATVSLSSSSLSALHRASGNRAVGTLIRRQAAETTRADARTRGAVSATIIMDEPIGVMPLISFSSAKESQVVVVVPSTSLDTDLMRFMVQGVKQKRVTISTQRFNLELDDVYISSFERIGSDEDAVVQMTLSFGAQRMK